MDINIKEFLKYKFLNSLFLGLSVGSIFAIYAPIEPSIYSIGGIVLAFGMLGVARLYHKILNIKSFYVVSLAVEIVLLISIAYFLIFSYSYITALMMYIGYQITFVFGSYLVRAETLFLSKKQILSTLDTYKQLGYLAGMLLSYVVYEYMKYAQITNNQLQVYNMHYILFVLEIIIIIFLVRSFNRQY